LLLGAYLYQIIAAAKALQRFPPPGKMIEVGGHKLHLVCKGSGNPTVVIEQGAGAPSIFWWRIQERIAEFARVCVYDRAGLGWSEPVPGPRSIEQRAADLHGLLVNAQVPEPYILVAHSYGGWIVRSFASEHREKVAGLVLVDTGEEGVYSQPDVVATYSKIAWISKALGCAAKFGILRILRPPFLKASVADLSPDIRRAAAAVCLKPHSFFTAADDIASVPKSPQAWLGWSEGANQLGDLPITVITHGQPFPGPFRVVEKYWNKGQKRLAALSTNSTFIVAEKSNHMIHDDQPDLVVDAIRRHVAAVRDQASRSKPAATASGCPSSSSKPQKASAV
jgi:pimeloyl-ACP methyl ester carboxylesterase